MIFVAVMSILLVGCDDKSVGGVKKTEESFAEKREVSNGETREETASNNSCFVQCDNAEHESVSDDKDDKKSPSDKKESEFIKKYFSEIDIEGRNYSLFYLNDDDIPEFAVYGDGTIHNGLVDVYTLEEGKIIEVGRVGSYDSVYYKEREGILVEEYDGSNGSYYTNIYKMEKGQNVVVEKVEVKGWDEDIAYFVNGEETDVDTYDSRIKKYRDDLSIVGAS